MRRELAILFDEGTDFNEAKIEIIGRFFNGALALLLVEVAGWLVQIATWR
jgi:hypothetical protein